MAVVYDLVVIGGGPGGFAAAMRAAQLGGTVALVEEKQLGGNCMHQACIPARALMTAARLAGSIGQAGPLGVQVGAPAVDMEAFHDRKNQVIKGLRMGTEELLSNHGVSLVRGRARLAAWDTVQVGEQSLEARNILVATGSVAAQLPVEGAELPGVIGTEEAIELHQIPPRMAILAASPTDLELAQCFHLLGCHVTLIESGPRLLPEADREISQRLGKLLHDAGIAIWRSAAVEAIRRREDGTLAVVLAEGKGKVLVDAVLAARRLPNTTGLGLRELGAKMVSGALVVDEHMRTSVPQVYAAGDAAAGPMWSHKATAEGIVVAESAMGCQSAIDYDALPWFLFTWPEVAWVGLTEEQAVVRGLEVAVGRAPLVINPYAIILGETGGIVKIVAERRYGKILGVHMMMPGAADLINAAAVAMLSEATVRELQRLAPAHPSLGEALVDAAMDVDKRSPHLPRFG
jgi:dihydrolipoamide dehydrogenase